MRHLFFSLFVVSTACTPLLPQDAASDASAKATCTAGALPAPPTEIPSRDYGLTISGAISVGTYEAGVNWALVAGMRAYRAKAPGLRPFMPRLHAVTGASAGAINTFLTSIAYCGKSQSTVADNVFLQSWSDVGWDALFPGRKSCEEYSQYFLRGRSEAEQATIRKQLDCGSDRLVYGADDGLLTRRGLRVAEKRLQETLTNDAFDPDCVLDLGVTLTATNPVMITSNNSQLSVPAQRLAVLAEARGSTKGMALAHPAPFASPLVGPRGWLAPPGTSLGTGAMVDVLEGASAFPVAFGTKMIEICDAPPEGKCPKRRFFDGGLYDNVPIGLAVALVENVARPRVASMDEVPRYLFIDPEQLRGLDPVQVTNQGKEGLPMLLDLLGSFVSVARKYELQAMVREQNALPKKTADLMSITRFMPIMGEHFQWFGAFAARPFRQYDYYVGVYDGLRALAVEVCGQYHITAPDLLARCAAAEVLRLHDALGLSDTPKDSADRATTRSASAIVKQLTLRELEVDLKGRPDAVAALGTSCEKAKADPVTQAIFEANLALDKKRRQSGNFALDANQFHAVAKAVKPEVEKIQPELELSQLGYSLSENDRLFFANSRAWVASQGKALSLRALDREADIQKQQADRAFLDGTTVYGTMAFAAHIAWPVSGWYWNGRHLPQVGMLSGHEKAPVILTRFLIPYEANLRFGLGWEIGFRGGYAWSVAGLNLALRPVSVRDQHVWFRPSLTLSLDLPTKWLPNLDFGVTTRIPYRPGDVPLAEISTFGPEVGLSFINGFVRVSVTREEVFNYQLERSAAAGYSVRIALEDLTSLAYWGSKIF